jgi:hypothetical protein
VQVDGAEDASVRIRLQAACVPQGHQVGWVGDGQRRHWHEAPTLSHYWHARCRSNDRRGQVGALVNDQVRPPLRHDPLEIDELRWSENLAEGCCRSLSKGKLGEPRIALAQGKRWFEGGAGQNGDQARLTHSFVETGAGRDADVVAGPGKSVSHGQQRPNVAFHR